MIPACAPRRELAAYHEAGHAVVAWLSDLPFEKISIVANEDEGYAGYIHSAWKRYVEDNPPLPTTTCHGCGAELDFSAALAAFVPDRDLRTEWDFAVNCICVLYAGGEATRLLTGRRDHVGPRADYREIGYIVAGCRTWPGKTHEKLLRGLQLRTRDLLQAHWPQVVALAEAVAERNELSEEEAVAALRRALRTAAEATT